MGVICLGAASLAGYGMGACRRLCGVRGALDEFESGSFEFAADASAIAITTGAHAGIGTTGATSGASGDMRDANTRSGGYQKGMVVFSIAKGGLMYAATVAGQKFTYSPRAPE